MVKQYTIQCSPTRGCTIKFPDALLSAMCIDKNDKVQYEVKDKDTVIMHIIRSAVIYDEYLNDQAKKFNKYQEQQFAGKSKDEINEIMNSYKSSADKYIKDMMNGEKE